MDKKNWKAPQLMSHGSIEDITYQVKPKTLGAIDDFGIGGISSA